MDEKETVAIDVGQIELPGLEAFIEENNGSETEALKALWFQWKQELNWKAYAIGANKSIMKLYKHLKTVIPMVSTCCGELSRRGYKSADGVSLEFDNAFQTLISIGMTVKTKEIEEKTTTRHIRKITTLPEGGTRITYDECDHTEVLDKDFTVTLKVGDKAICPTCHSMLETLEKTT